MRNDADAQMRKGMTFTPTSVRVTRQPDRDRLQGLAAGLAEANRLHDVPQVVADTLRGFGLSIEDLAAHGVEDHDLDELRKCLAEAGGA